MRKRRLLSMIMAIMMVLCMLPAAVFAEGAGQPLGGTLQINAPASVGAVLRADFSKVTPENMTEECFDFQWYRKNGQEQTDLGTELSYTVTEEDLGSQILLVVTGIEEFGISGVLSAVSNPVTATKEEAVSWLQAQPNQANVVLELQETEDQQVYSEDIIPEEGELLSEENGIILENMYSEDLYTEDGYSEDGYIENEYGEGIDEPGDEQMLPEEGAVSQGEEFLINEGEYPEEDLWTEASADQGETETLDSGESWDISEEVPWTELEQDDPEGDQRLLDEAAGIIAGSQPETIPEQNPLSAQAGNSDNVMEFGEVSVSDISDVPVQYAQITNNGSETLYFSEIYPEHFMADDISVLEPGQTAEVFVQPREGIEPGTYSDPIVYTATTGETVEFQAQVVVSGDQPDPEPTVPADPEPTVPADPEPTVPAASVTVDPAEYGFGSVVENEDGSYPVPEAATFKLTVTGTISFSDLTLTGPENSVFTASAIAEDGTFTIQPSAVPAERYGENITETYTVSYPGMVETAPSVTLSFRVDLRNPQITIIAPEDKFMDFGELTVGYEVPEARDVTVKNTGNTKLTLIETVAEDFDIILPEDTELDPGEEAVIKISLKAGLPETAGALEEVEIFTEEGCSDLVSVAYAINPQATPTPVPDTSEKLLKVYNASEITGLKNGVDKSAAGLTLPSKVAIETTKGKKTAAVTWDVASCAYNPASAARQTFTVSGRITLPEGVEQNGVSLVTSVKVTVNAYDPYKPADGETYITGISSSAGYTTDSEISFQAVGGGMNRDSIAREGDVEYVPSGWTVLDTRPFMDTTYKSTFRIKQAGDYTLTVTFDEKVYSADGQWVKTGKQITRSVNFHVAQGQTVTVTPTAAAGSGNTANQKAAVQTGDDTNILPFVIILILAAVCIAVVLVYRKKNK